MSTDRMRTVTAVTAMGAGQLHLSWSDGCEVALQARQLGMSKSDIAGVQLGDWGHSIVLGSGDEIGADRLWLETLSANGRDDARRFLEWRMRHGLSLSKAAEALGLARRTVAYYSNGDRPVPKTILLACKGWEASAGLAQAA